MSGGGAPADRSVELEQQKEQYAAQQQAIQDRKDKATAARLAALNTAAQGSARQSASDYFTSQGVDPAQYQAQIGNAITNAAGLVPADSTNPATYYQDIGQKVYDTATETARNKATAGLQTVFPSNYEYTKIPDAIDQPYLTGIEKTQEQAAMDYLNNLLSRGVITQSGFDAGQKNLTGQEAGAWAKLNEIGSGVEAAGRSALTDVSNRAFSTAGNLKLGQAFDPATYSSQVDKAFNDWMNNLGTTISGKIPQNSLFDTSGLSTIAGAAQGAGNTAYDPNAVAGLLGDTTQKNNTGVTGRTDQGTGVF